MPAEDAGDEPYSGRHIVMHSHHRVFSELFSKKVKVVIPSTICLLHSDILVHKVPRHSISAPNPRQPRVVKKLIERNPLQLSMMWIIGIDLRHLVFRDQLRLRVAQNGYPFELLAAAF